MFSLPSPLQKLDLSVFGVDQKVYVKRDDLIKTLDWPNRVIIGGCSLDTKVLVIKKTNIIKNLMLNRYN